MRKYHLYCLDEQGKIHDDDWLDAVDDDDAINQARAMKKPYACELWDRARKLASIPAHSDA